MTEEKGLSSAGLIEYDFNSHQVNMYVQDKTNKGVIAHELKHSYQFEMGEIAFAIKGSVSGSLFLDEGDEDQAYSRNQILGYTDGYGYGDYGHQNVSKEPRSIREYGWDMLEQDEINFTASVKLYLKKFDISKIAFRTNQRKTYEFSKD